jgi:uncharacterized protein (TIGR03084 family)
MVTIGEVLDDLEAEWTDLHGMVADLPDEKWDLATPAEGWSVRDQIGHLAYFDAAARMAVVDPGGFDALVAEVVGRGGDPMAEHLARGRSMSEAELLGWLETAHADLMTVLRQLGPEARVAWFGPAMGAASFVSARLMETWAHGQDVADALGATRVPTDRLRHIAHLGVRARGFSYAVRGLEVPAGVIDVVLAGPSGEQWTWRVGDATAGDTQAGADVDGESAASVRGSAEEFCLVVTQRRYVFDTSLMVNGDSARDWLLIAQAFAGPPGAGRGPSTAV